MLDFLRQRIEVFFVPLTLVLLAAMSLAARKPHLELTSPAFKDGDILPVRFVMPQAGGENVSPPLRWTGAPAGTKSFALLCTDLHPVARRWVHWMVINLPAGTSSLPEGASGQAMPAGARELKNSFGFVGYGGPQPPPGTGRHPYVFTLYALDVERLDLPVESTLADFEAALRGHVLARASITAYFGR